MIKAPKKMLGKKYASALFEVAVESGVVNKLEQDLHKIKDFLDRDNKFSSVFLSDVIPSKIKYFLIENMKKALELHDTTCNFLKLLVKNNRTYTFFDVVIGFHEMLCVYNNKIEVTVKSAHPISQQQKKELLSILEEKFAKKIDIKEVVDTTLLGGISVQADSILFDGTLLNKINRLYRAIGV